jgi:hypothetical protein
MKKCLLISLAAVAVVASSLTSCVKNDTVKNFTSDDVEQYLTTTECSVPAKSWLWFYCYMLR